MGTITQSTKTARLPNRPNRSHCARRAKSSSSRASSTAAERGRAVALKRNFAWLEGLKNHARSELEEVNRRYSVPLPTTGSGFPKEELSVWLKANGREPKSERSRFNERSRGCRNGQPHSTS